MKKVMLIGEGRSGKRKLIQALADPGYVPRKALALDFYRNFVNTPSEFLENRRFYRALITASADCDILLFLQDATRAACQMPPAFASMFNRRVVGIITNGDAPGAFPDRARRFLENTGVREILAVSVEQGTGIKELRALLE